VVAKQLTTHLEKYSGKVTALVLLDLSAAFDTNDHEILLIRIATDVGVAGIALTWFRSYLSGLTQVVSCADNLSPSRLVTCGVPRGSVLGPLLFCIYTHLLEQIIERHKIQHQFYADDTQLYLSLDLCDAQSAMRGSTAVLSTFERRWQRTF